MKMADKKSIINKKILFIVVGAAIFIGLGIGVWHFADVQPTKFDSSLYGKSEAIDISKNEYEQMIGDKKSFAVLIDSPTCIRSKKIERMMGEMDSKYQFKYYVNGKPKFVYSWRLEPTDKTPRGNGQGRR